MISSPTDSGSVPVQRNSWWLDSWKSYICAGLAVVESLFGVITAISLSPMCIIAGILQIVAGVVVLAVEAPTIVSFLKFAQPIGMFFDGKPIWMKTALYAVVALIPIFLTCSGFFLILGLLCGIGIAAVYGLLILGPKANRDDMKFQAERMGSSEPPPPYSPTSP